MTTQRFVDGCHRYGWIITLIGLAFGVIVNIMYVSYQTGLLTQKVDDMKMEVQHMQGQIDGLITRGRP